MKTYLIPSLKLTLITSLIFGVLYPLLITGFAKVAAPNGGNGKEISVNDKVVGFEVIGQKFENPSYFNGRPSAVNYNAAATGGSNKGPSNADYLNVVEERIATFLRENSAVQKKDIPVDLLTASGGGLDPHISPTSAYVQVKRIARMRNINEIALRKLVDNSIERPLLNLFGPPTINVLKLNIALDKIN